MSLFATRPRPRAAPSAAPTEYLPYREFGQALSETFDEVTAALLVSRKTGHSRFEPMPDAGVVARYYQRVTPSEGDATYNLSTQFRPEIVAVAEGVKNHMTAYAGLGVDLVHHDVGCAFGALVYGFQQLGNRSSGNEENALWVRVGNGFCNDALTAGTIAQAAPKMTGTIDLFTVLHTLEHMPDPLAALKVMAERLSLEGVVYICVPNTASIQYVLGGRRNDPAYVFPMHLQHFTPASLIQHVRAAGLEPLLMQGRWLPDPLHGPDYLHRYALGVEKAEASDAGLIETTFAHQLLGGEIFILAGHPSNRRSLREDDIDARAEVALRLVNPARSELIFPDPAGSAG